MESSTFSSSALGAGELYDRFTEAMAMVYDENLHYGYWPDPDSGEPLAAATVRMTDELIERLGARRGDHVLDLGCGTGAPALRLAHVAGVQVTGVTVSRRQAAVAEAAASAAGLADAVRFVFADAMQLPFEDQALDRVWALESLHHMPDRAHVLREIARVLRPGGRLAAADIVFRGPVEDAAAREVVARFCTAAQVPALERLDTYPALVERAGLVLTEVEDVTEHTRRTFGEILRAFRSFDVTSIGMSAAELSEKVRIFEAVTALPQFGFAFLVAHKE
ncbi:methyltransferase domain-containing protein [Streptomyces sp. NBC_00019]|uniref:SAM-dependent methyltransferase n=1 Tax=Streptomyces sp. NBC_00019 TaxID=2975623 RepID=UPI002F91215E